VLERIPFAIRLTPVFSFSVMVARGAQWNPSVFNPNGMLPVYDMMNQYLSLAKQYDNHFSNTKYTLCKMQSTHVKGAASHLIARCKSYEQLEVAMEKLALQPALCKSGNGMSNISHCLLMSTCLTQSFLCRLSSTTTDSRAFVDAPEGWRVITPDRFPGREARE
jgi:hypothetical protein